MHHTVHSPAHKDQKLGPDELLILNINYMLIHAVETSDTHQVLIINESKVEEVKFHNNIWQFPRMYRKILYLGIRIHDLCMSYWYHSLV